MLFNSFEFLAFLPIVFLLYWFVFCGRQWQNLLIVVASYLFYGWWNWRFLFLIALTSFCSYGSGMLLEYYEGQRRKQKLVSASNIVLNLGILGVFVERTLCSMILRRDGLMTSVNILRLNLPNYCISLINFYRFVSFK